jgi:hypothetical protein
MSTDHPNPGRGRNNNRLLLFAPEGAGDRRDVEPGRQHDPGGYRRENEDDNLAVADHR